MAVRADEAEAELNEKDGSGLKLESGTGAEESSGEDQRVPLKDTVVPFKAPLKPPREPAILTSQAGDQHVLGPQVLAFADKESWEQGSAACERVATDQCEKGARMGCSVTAARRCQPNWFQRLPFLKKKSTPETAAAQEACETREFDACFSKARQKCTEHSNKLCGDVYGQARIAGKDDVMLITSWEDDDELNEYRQLQIGEKVISSSKGAPWMPPALGASIETQVPDEADAERRRSGRKAGSASAGVKPAVKEAVPKRYSTTGGLWSSQAEPEERGPEPVRKPSKPGSEKGSKQVTGKDGVAYRVVRIASRMGPDGKPLRALQSLKDGTVKFMDADGQIKTLVGREKREEKREQGGGVGAKGGREQIVKSGR